MLLLLSTLVFRGFEWMLVCVYTKSEVCRLVEVYGYPPVDDKTVTVMVSFTFPFWK